MSRYRSRARVIEFQDGGNPLEVVTLKRETAPVLGQAVSFYSKSSFTSLDDIPNQSRLGNCSSFLVTKPNLQRFGEDLVKISQPIDQEDDEQKLYDALGEEAFETKEADQNPDRPGFVIALNGLVLDRIASRGLNPEEIDPTSGMYHLIRGSLESIDTEWYALSITPDISTGYRAILTAEQTAAGLLITHRPNFRLPLPTGATRELGEWVQKSSQEMQKRTKSIWESTN